VVVAGDLDDFVGGAGAALAADGAEDFFEVGGGVDVLFDEEGAGCGVGVVWHRGGWSLYDRCVYVDVNDGMFCLIFPWFEEEIDYIHTNNSHV
jgi:hypothetical protein